MTSMILAGIQAGYGANQEAELPSHVATLAPLADEQRRLLLMAHILVRDVVPWLDDRGYWQGAHRKLTPPITTDECQATRHRLRKFFDVVAALRDRWRTKLKHEYSDSVAASLEWAAVTAEITWNTCLILRGAAEFPPPEPFTLGQGFGDAIRWRRANDPEAPSLDEYWEALQVAAPLTGQILV